MAPSASYTEDLHSLTHTLDRKHTTVGVKVELVLKTSDGIHDDLVHVHTCEGHLKERPLTTDLYTKYNYALTTTKLPLN